MASYRYLTTRKKNKAFHIKGENTNILHLIKEAKAEEKREKRKNIYIAAAAISALALSGFIIS